MVQEVAKNDRGIKARVDARNCVCILETYRNSPFVREHSIRCQTCSLWGTRSHHRDIV